jgi:hypothetical protein
LRCCCCNCCCCWQSSCRPCLSSCRCQRDDPAYQAVADLQQATLLPQRPPLLPGCCHKLVLINRTSFCTCCCCSHLSNVIAVSLCVWWGMTPPGCLMCSRRECSPGSRSHLGRFLCGSFSLGSPLARLPAGTTPVVVLAEDMHTTQTILVRKTLSAPRCCPHCKRPSKKVRGRHLEQSCRPTTGAATHRAKKEMGLGSSWPLVFKGPPGRGGSWPPNLHSRQAD